MGSKIISGRKMNRFPTRDFNDLLRFMGESGEFGNIQANDTSRNADIVSIRNDTGADIDSGSVLGIDGILIEHADNETEFRRMPGLKGVTFDPRIHARKWVHTLEPIYDGRIGKATYRGLTIAQVDSRSGFHTHCTPRTDGDTNAPPLWTEFGGSARIISIETGDGPRWAMLDMEPQSGPWWTEGFLNEELEAATVLPNRVEATSATMRVWLTDDNHDLDTNTQIDITVWNRSELTFPSESYVKARFDEWEWLPFFGGGAGAEIIRFRVLDAVDYDEPCAECLVTGIMCNNASVEVGEQVTVIDRLGCLFNLDPTEMLARQGYAVRMQGGTYGECGGTDTDCSWEAMFLCVEETCP